MPALGDDAVILDGHEADDIRAHLDGEDEETARRFGWWPERSTEATVRAAFEDWAIQWRSGGPTRAFAVRDRATRTLVGGCELRCGPDGTGQVSYWISARHRGNGYATRALSLLCGYAFSIGITRLEAHVAPDNYASRAVAEHAGFAGHGTFTGDGGQPLVRYTRTAAPGLNARAHIIRIKPMRRESSTVVALVGDVGDGLLAGLVKSPGVSVVRAGAGTREPDESAGAQQRPAWEAGALALGEATRHQSMYVIVPEDPLAGVAAGWRAMWDLSAGPGGGAGFERQAADALAAWRNKRFELPDYYLVVAPPQASAAGPDLYLGPLRSVRPRRVAVAGVAQGPAQLPVLVDTLTSLQHGPWWPPLNELLDAARGFYAGGLAETQPRPGAGG